MTKLYNQPIVTRAVRTTGVDDVSDVKVPRIALVPVDRHTATGLVTMIMTEDEFLVLGEMVDYFISRSDGVFSELDVAVLRKLGHEPWCGPENRWTPDPDGNPIDIRHLRRAT